MSSTNDPTRWTETHLLFRPDAETPNTGTVVGRGTSLWRRMHVPFEVWGTYDLARFTVHLRKQHTGRYNNMVNFWGTILRAWRVASRGAALEPRLVITGRYSYGDFELSRVAGATAAAPIAPGAYLTWMWCRQTRTQQCGRGWTPCPRKLCAPSS